MFSLLEILAAFTNDLDITNPFGVFWFVFKSGGWIIILIFLLWGFWQLWLDHIQNKYASTLEWVYLAIDVPRENEQSLKAVEQIFAQIAGAHATLSFVEKYWKGKTQAAFSFEIVSIDGHIQFIVRCQKRYRDLIESTIYAQYPDAEITEVEDYTKNVPNASQWPDPDWNLWGTEIVLVKDEHFPIRTYYEFEHSLPQVFADPLAAILEFMGKIKPGEQIWLQFIIQHPNEVTWGKGGEKVVAKLLGKKVKQESGALGKIVEAPLNALSFVSQEFIGSGFMPDSEESKDDLNFGAFSLSPGEIEQVKAVQQKISKIGFHTKIRLVYISKKEVYDKSRASAIFGTIKQYNTQNFNSLKPHSKTMTAALYFRVKQRIITRQKKILAGYKGRSTWRGTGKGKMFNIEELASLWHFPLYTVTGPLIKRAEAKKAGPPENLKFEDEPIEELNEEKDVNINKSIETQIIADEQEIKEIKPSSDKTPIKLDKDPQSTGAPPTNLPI